ncbi:MAG: bifunctional riboflavin kinase/FMN adenylyltransferase [Kiritimatiellia bacterium]
MRAAALPSLAVGFFDGVHLGHREILRGAAAAMTFANHPLSVLAPARAPRLIMSVADRVAAIRACGVPDVTVLDFTPELAATRAEGFVDFLARRLGRRFRAFRCGANWRFGKGGEGNAEFLRQRGLSVEVAPYVEYRGERISSSRIRASLERGEIADANAMLGRNFRVRGRPVRGKGLGAQIGYPTVNLRLAAPAPDAPLVLPLGVYEVALDGHRGIANYGLAPTFGDRAWPSPVLEVHLLSDRPALPDPLSPAAAAVEIVRFLRPERKFASVGELQAQIAADCAAVR